MADVLSNPIPERYRSEHLFLLMGTNPLPNYVAARLLLETKGRLHLLASNQTKSVASQLAKKTYSFSNPDIVLLDEADPLNIRKVIQDQIAHLPPTTRIGLNYTGGTKAMAVHVHSAIEKQFPEAVFSYLNARTNKMIINYQLLQDAFPLLDSLQFQLEDLLDLHSEEFDINDDGQTIEPLYEASHSQEAAVFVEVLQQKLADSVADAYRWLKIWREWCTKVMRNNGSWTDFKKVDRSKLKKIEFPTNPELALAKKIWGTARNLGELAASWRWDVTDVAGWLDGKWLEHYTLKAVQRAQPSIRLHESCMCIKTRGIKSTRHFELDVAALQGYRLFGITCYSGLRHASLKQKLFEGYIRTAQMGGEEARTALVCCVLPYDVVENRDSTPQSIVREVQDDWDVQEQVQVFGLEHLPELETHLQEWFNQR